MEVEEDTDEHIHAVWRTEEMSGVLYSSLPCSMR